MVLAGRDASHGHGRLTFFAEVLNDRLKARRVFRAETDQLFIAALQTGIGIRSVISIAIEKGLAVFSCDQSFTDGSICVRQP